MKPYKPSSKLAVRDSLEDEFSDDVEDDVFIRDGKSAKKYEENGLKRPLMAPRRKKHKSSNNVTAILQKRRAKCWKLCEPFCYGFVAVSIILAIILFAAIILTMFPVPLQKIKVWLRKDISTTVLDGQKLGIDDYSMFYGETIPCTQISVRKIWSKAFSKLSSESPVRKSDINGDNVEDIIVGFGVDDSFLYDVLAIPKCDSAVGFNCEGGILALDGVTGSTLWQTWTAFNVFSLHCNQDLNGDKQFDCVAAGRGGLVIGVDGKTGAIIWKLADRMEFPLRTLIVDLYTVNAIRDINDDEVSDIIAVHVEESENDRMGHIKLISGKDGTEISSISTPLKEEVFVPVQFITGVDGNQFLLIITGGQNSAGGLYLLRIESLIKKPADVRYEAIYQNHLSGFMVPAILTDITADGVEDIVIASFNSTVFAFDGKSHAIIWTFVFPASETVSSIVPGHFNNDNVTDFMVKYNSGPGFPIYYYSQTTILNGVNGESLLTNMIKDSGGSYTLLGGISISQIVGGDFFLHWQTHCQGQLSNYSDAYQFLPDSDIVQQARADTCKLRYNTSTVLKLNAIVRHIEPPGAVIFSTDDLILQLNETDTKHEQNPKSVSAIKHPKMLKKTLNKEVIENNAPSERTTQYMTSPVADRDAVETDNIIKKAYNIPSRDYILNQGVLNVGGEPDAIEYNEEQRKVDKLNDQTINEMMMENYLNYPDDTKKYPLMLSKYPINTRDIRSREDFSDFEDLDEKQVISNENSTLTAKQKTLIKNQEQTKQNVPAETLWDLEVEKEIHESASSDSNYRAARQVDSTQNYLPSISSTGVLLASVEKSPGTLDFVFVLNVRQSEAFPPLLLPSDLACVEEKMNAYRSFTAADLLALEKKVFKQCLRQRFINTPTKTPIKFESQIVITRISISCGCSNIKDGEICSGFNSIDKQKWTGFMGNDGNGLYPS